MFTCKIPSPYDLFCKVNNPPINKSRMHVYAKYTREWTPRDLDQLCPKISPHIGVYMKRTVEFKLPWKVLNAAWMRVRNQDFRKITDTFREIYGMFFNFKKGNRKMSTYNWLVVLETLKSRPIMPKNLPTHWCIYEVNRWIQITTESFECSMNVNL